MSMINKILTTIFCLSLLVCGTAEAKKKVEQAKDGPFTEINFSTIKSPNQNPFGLVYKGALTANDPGRVSIHRISYSLDGLKIAANVYSIKRGQRLGTAAFYSGDTLVSETDIVAKSEVKRLSIRYVFSKLLLNVLEK